MDRKLRSVEAEAATLLELAPAGLVENHALANPPAARPAAQIAEGEGLRLVGRLLTETAGSHAVYVSNPAVVAHIIEDAAKAASK